MEAVGVLMALLWAVPPQVWRWGAGAALALGLLWWSNHAGVVSERARGEALRAAEVLSQIAAVDQADRATAEQMRLDAGRRRGELDALMALRDLRTGAPCLSDAQSDALRGIGR
jgi:hypothetical protein